MPTEPGVSIDQAHCDLLAGLVRAQKPESILEFGFGGGASLRSIHAASEANGNRKEYVLVDNWADWGGKMPESAYEKYREYSGICMVFSHEGDFVQEAVRTGDTFDFILSDADHQHTHEWFERVYGDLLNPGGILVYHDACNPNYPGIGGILQKCHEAGTPCVLFNKSSQAFEDCERGLLVIFKPVE